MNVYPVGSKVLIGPEDDKLEGVITAIFIRANKALLYEVAWWDCRSLRSETLYDFQVEAITEERLTIGFKT